MKKNLKKTERSNTNRKKNNEIRYLIRVIDVLYNSQRAQSVFFFLFKKKYIKTKHKKTA